MKSGEKFDEEKSKEKSNRKRDKAPQNLAPESQADSSTLKPAKPIIAISIGDCNGVGCEILLRELAWLHAHCEPIICAHRSVLDSALGILADSLAIAPSDVRACEDLLSRTRFCPPIDSTLTIAPPAIEIGRVSAVSGVYSFASFKQAIALAESKQASGIVTLPIHKAAWQAAGVHYAGHTEYLRAHFKREVAMVLGCEKMFVALFSDHVPLARVSGMIELRAYREFLLILAQGFSGLGLDSSSQALVLGFNPHCGDHGAIGGREDAIIAQALREANAMLGREVFVGVCPPDSAFTPASRARFRVFVAPYHDIGLAPLKALYFDESINISLNLPIARSSVDHGVAYDIAYRGRASSKSFKNAVLFHR